MELPPSVWDNTDVKNIARKKRISLRCATCRFFEPFVSLISGGGFVLGEIQRIKHQKALEYWSQILKEQQESGLCIKAFCRSRQMSHHAMYYWIKELREEALLVNPLAPACTTQFAPVSLVLRPGYNWPKGPKKNAPPRNKRTTIIISAKLVRR